MKTILLEIEDNSYQILLNFIQSLPGNQCHIIEQDNELSIEENQFIQNCLSQIEKGDYSEFDNWEIVKNQL
ncbi:MAG: hypothetical protein WAX77_13415 [Methylococcaceae bacterium]